MAGGIQKNRAYRCKDHLLIFQHQLDGLDVSADTACVLKGITKALLAQKYRLYPLY